jgi:hypothetical protein
MSEPRDCKHGSLARKCEICERDAEIERLRARVQQLEAALKPFAAVVSAMTDLWDDEQLRIGLKWELPITVGDLRAAKEASQ